MQWQDKGIITSARKYGENSAIVGIFTPSHGMKKAMVRSINSKKNRGVYQVGNIVDVVWRGRLAEQLGNFYCELDEAIPLICLASSKRLLAIEAICYIVENIIPENYAHSSVFEQMITLLQRIKLDDHWQIYQIYFELELLLQGGFRLELDKCAATGQEEDLFYVSPKSGKAVCKNAGDPYAKKLLLLPNFLKKEYNGEEITEKDITNGLYLCRYFFQKHIFSENKEFPLARIRLESVT